MRSQWSSLTRAVRPTRLARLPSEKRKPSRARATPCSDSFHHRGTGEEREKAELLGKHELFFAQENRRRQWAIIIVGVQRTKR